MPRPKSSSPSSAPNPGSGAATGAVEGPSTGGSAGTPKGEAARERIIMATITCFERLGIEGTGVREIAEEASVNVAAINYHFRSKDNLFNIVLERTLHNAFSQMLVDFDERVQEGSSLRAALESVIDEAVAGAVRYPRITYAHLREPIVEQRYDVLIMHRVSDFIDGLARRVQPKRSEHVDRRVRMALAQIWSVVMISGLLPRYFHRAGGVELEQVEARRQFVAQLVRLVFTDDAPAVSERAPGKKK